MSKEPKKRTLKKLELNRETITDLTEQEAEGVEGGVATFPQTFWNTCACSNTCTCDPTYPIDHNLSQAVQLDCVRAR